jgi:hypothetical protein
MRAHDWTDVWNFFLDWMSHQTVPIQIAIGLGAAFVAVMALEGVRASFFPKRILESAALRNAGALQMSADFTPQEIPHAAWSDEPAAAPPVTVNSETARRSSPPQMRILGQRKPS